METTASTMEIEQWWEQADEEKRKFFRDIFFMIETTGLGDTFTLEFNDGKFVPTQYTDEDGEELTREVLMVMRAQTLESFWEDLGADRRPIVFEIGRMVEQVRLDPQKRLEATHIEEGISLEVVLKLQRAIGGRAAAN